MPYSINGRLICCGKTGSDQWNHVVIDCSTQLSMDAINQLLKKLMMVIKVKGAYAEFRLDQFCVHVWVINWAKSIHFFIIQNNFRASEYLWKLGKEYLNALTCNLCAFSRQNSATFDINYRKVINSQKQSGFLAHLYIMILRHFPH